MEAYGLLFSFMVKFNHMKNFIKKHKKLIVIIVVIIIAIGGYFFFTRDKEQKIDFIAAKKGNVTQEVSATGHVDPATSVDLAFEKGGKVSAVYVSVGDKVSAGQILATLNNADIIAQINSAEANLKSQQAKLEELKKGTKLEEIRVYEVKVQNAKIALDDAKQNLLDKIQDAYTKADDAVRNKIDYFMSNPRTSNPQLNLAISDTDLKQNIEAQRIIMESLLNSWDYNDSSRARNNLNQIKSFLNQISSAVNSLSVSSSLTQTTIDTYKSNVSTARTNIDTAISNLTSAEEKLKTAESSLLLAQNELVLKQSGSTSEEIKVQEALIEKAEADIRVYKAELNKTIIYSPVNGIVTKQDAKIGEIISANINAISVISEAKFEIKANVPEADIAKVKVEDTARVTLDAYGNDVEFQAKVIKIDPAETVIEGVPTYKTTFRFINEDGRIKSGMTANIDILTGIRENVIVIPQRTVAQKNGDKIVKILKDDGSIEERKVKTGLKGSDGNIEILEGIQEGEKIITSTK